MNAICSIISIMWRYSFWDGNISNMAQFRCDVRDKGDSYLLEAELLPGFEREDIGIDLDGTTLVITARHSEGRERTKTATICAGSASLARSAAASTFQAWIRNTSAPHAKRCAGLTLPKQAARVPQARASRSLGISPQVRQKKEEKGRGPPQMSAAHGP